MASVHVQNHSRKRGILKHIGSSTGEDLSLVTFKAEVQTSPHKLARNGNLEELKRLLDRVQALNVLDESGSTILHSATETNQVSIMHYLLDCGIDRNAVDHYGNTALHVAVKNECIDALHLLLSNGASDSICNNAHDPPLHLAVRKSNPALVSAFLEHQVDLLVRGFRNRTSLHVIAENDNLESLKAIHESSLFVELQRESRCFQVRVVDDDRLTPVHLAAKRGSYRVLDLMISKSLELGLPKEVVLHFLDEENSSPAQYAVEIGCVKSLEVLLKYGASPTLSKGDMLPPLHLACYQGKPDMVQTMIQHCGVEILQSRDQQEMTVLHRSCMGQYSEGMISYLCEQGAELNTQDINGSTALHTAIVSGNVSAVEELTKLGSDPTIRDLNGQNSLHHAVLQNRQEILGRLLEHKGSTCLISEPDINGSYPIHYALNHGLYEMVMSIHTSLLLHHPNHHIFQDSKNNNYLHLAAHAGDFKTLTRLLDLPDSRSMLNATNNMGCTPLHSAASGGNVACVKALVNKGAVVHKCHSGQTPLMHACHVGSLQAARALYDAHPFQKDWVDDDGNTILHHATECRNPAVIQFCLDIGTAIILNSEGKSFIDKILQNADTELALTVLHHNRWEECLDISSSFSPHPMLQLIQRMPAAAIVVLDNCHLKSALDSQHPDYWEEFNFKYLMLSDHENEPTPVHEKQHGGDGQAAVPVGQEVETHRDNLGSIKVEQPSSLTPSVRSNLLERNCLKKKKASSMEVLQWMVQYKRTQCLMHPVIKSFLKTKWSDHGRYIYLVRFLLVALLTIFLSIFIGITPPPTQIRVGSGNGSTEMGENDIGTASNVIRFITLFLCLVNTVLCILDMSYYRLQLLDINRYIFTWTYAATIISTYVFLIPGGGLNFVIWEAGALAAFFAWFNLAIFLQLNSIFGLYIVMFLRISKTVIQVLLLLSFFFICGFALSFYILLGSVEGLSNLRVVYYATFLSLLVANDYEGIVALDMAGSLRFGALVFIFMVLLAILMPIVLVNLLIGLALDDIEQIKQEAIILTTENKVVTLAFIEDHMLPTKILKRLQKVKLKQYPNSGSWMTTTWRFFWTMVKTDSVADNDGGMHEMVKTSQEDLRDQKLDQLQRQIDKLSIDQARQLEAMKQLQETLSKFVEMQGRATA